MEAVQRATLPFQTPREAGSDAFIGLATLDVSPAKHLVGRRTPGDGEWSQRLTKICTDGFLDPCFIRENPWLKCLRRDFGTFHSSPRRAASLR